MKKPHFAEGGIYHIYNRGIEKRDVFLDETDYFRFIHSLYEMNDERPVRNLHFFFNPKTMLVESRPVSWQQHPRNRLVDILVFTLMPNHYHLMLRQIQENGIVRFMQKLGTGYTMFFNKKYDRVGSLFQGRFKAAHITNELHFIHLPHYIHTNPLSMTYRGSTSIEFLEGYRWSSFPDYIGQRNFPSVTERDLLLDMFGGEGRYLRHTEDWLNADSETRINNIYEVILE